MTQDQMKKAKRPAKRPVGRAPTGHTFIGIRVLPELLARIDKWRERNALDRSKAIKTLVEIGLKHDTD